MKAQKKIVEQTKAAIAAEIKKTTGNDIVWRGSGATVVKKMPLPVQEKATLQTYKQGWKPLKPWTSNDDKRCVDMQDEFGKVFKEMDQSTETRVCVVCVCVCVCARARVCVCACAARSRICEKLCPMYH
jgi:hypothetical protein